MNKFMLLVLATMTQMVVFAGGATENSELLSENLQLSSKIGELQRQLDAILKQSAQDRISVIKDLAQIMTLYFHLHYEYEDNVEQGIYSKAILKVLLKRKNDTTSTLVEFPSYAYSAHNSHPYSHSKEEVLRHFEAYLLIMDDFSHMAFPEDSKFLTVKREIEQFIQLVREKLQNAQIIKEEDCETVPESPGSKLKRFYYFQREAGAITGEFRKVMLPYYDIELKGQSRHSKSFQ